MYVSVYKCICECVCGGEYRGRITSTSTCVYMHTSPVTRPHSQRSLPPPNVLQYDQAHKATPPKVTLSLPPPDALRYDQAHKATHPKVALSLPPSLHPMPYSVTRELCQHSWRTRYALVDPHQLVCPSCDKVLTT